MNCTKQLELSGADNKIAVRGIIPQCDELLEDESEGCYPYNILTHTIYLSLPRLEKTLATSRAHMH